MALTFGSAAFRNALIQPLPIDPRLTMTLQPDKPTAAMIKNGAKVPAREQYAQFYRAILTALGTRALNIVGTTLRGTAWSYGKAFTAGITLIQPSDSKSRLALLPPQKMTLALRERKRDAPFFGFEWGRLVNHLSFEIDKNGKGLRLGATDEAVKQRSGLAQRAFTYADMLNLFEKGGTIPITAATRKYAMFQANKYALLDYGVASAAKLEARGDSRAMMWYALAKTTATSYVIQPRPMLEPAMQMAAAQLASDPAMGTVFQDFITVWLTKRKKGGMYAELNQMSAAPAAPAPSEE